MDTKKSVKVEAEEPELTGEELRDQKLMGGVIRTRREALGLSLADLASRMGEPFTEELIAGYESGDVPMEATRVLELMKALGISEEAMNPRRLLMESFVRTGYCSLTDELREVVDQLASSLAKVEQQKSSEHGIAG